MPFNKNMNDKDFFIQSILKLNSDIKLKKKIIKTLENLSIDSFIFNKLFSINYQEHFAYKYLDNLNNYKINNLFIKSLNGIIENEILLKKNTKNIFYHDYNTNSSVFNTRGLMTYKSDLIHKNLILKIISKCRSELLLRESKKEYERCNINNMILYDNLPTKSKTDVFCSKNNINSAIYANIKKLLKDHDIFKLLEERHNNIKFKISRINYFVNSSSVYNDPPLAGHDYLPDATYFHIDSSNKNPPYKVLIYLNNIEEINETVFRIIPESQNTFNIVERSIRKTNDKIGIQNGKKKIRIIFNSLPEIFKFKADFGRDTINNSELSNYLLQNELLINKKDDIILFNVNCIHRGCLFNKNSNSYRELLQINFHASKKNK
tara:strand:- start:30 stop:1160 length:1131 start_codon:yes stop_codon:yes gene_type:complete